MNHPKHLLLRLSLLSLTIISIIACDRDDKLYRLTEEEKSFMAYDLKEQFQLQDVANGEIVDLTVTVSEIYTEKDNGGYAYPIAGGGGDDIVENGIIKFVDNSGCYEGQILVKGSKDESFAIRVSLLECFGGYFFEVQNPQVFGPVTINGLTYQDCYEIGNASIRLYYSKEKGIVKIENLVEDVDLFVISE